MEISIEIKAKVFAQYWGQTILQTPGVNGLFEVNGIDLEDSSVFPHCKLKLKPLSSITDEDAIEVAKLIFEKSYSSDKKHDQLVLQKCQAEVFVKTMNDTPNTGVEKLFIYQFLQSRGYDLPQHLLNGKTLKEAGLAIYE